MLEILEGYETRKTLAALLKRYSNVQFDISGGNGCSFTTGKTIGTCVQVTRSSGIGLLVYRKRETLKNPAGYVVKGAAVYVASAQTLPDIGPDLMIFLDSVGGVQGVLKLTNQDNANFRLKAYTGPSSGGTLLGESGNIPKDAWCYIEARFVVATGSGRFQVRLNSNTTPIFDFTLINTNPTGVNNVNSVETNIIAVTAGDTMKIDDEYLVSSVDNGDGIVNYLSEVVIEGVLSATDATPNQWSPNTGTNHSALVDDPSEGDGDTTNLQVASDDQQELFNMAALTFGGSSIVGVQLELEARLTAGSSKNIKAVVKTSGGTTGKSAAIAVNSTAYKAYDVPFGKNPATGVAWDPVDFSTGKMGFESAA